MARRGEITVWKASSSARKTNAIPAQNQKICKAFPHSPQQNRRAPARQHASLRNLFLMTAVARLLVKVGVSLSWPVALSICWEDWASPLAACPAISRGGGRHFTVFFPIGTSILLSVLLTLLFWLLSRFRR